MESPIDEIQADTLRVLRTLLQPGAEAALVDFPSHQNAGDSLIYAGEMAYFRKLSISVDYICDIDRFDEQRLRSRVSRGPILLHGGGNFGDRWPRYQEFREMVVRRFRDREIIMLPQSMEFRSPAALDRAKRTFEAHPALTLMLREQPSYQRAMAEFGSHNNVVYCPDMAVGYGPQPRSRVSEQVKVLKLLRQDSEAIAHGELELSCESAELDWGLTSITDRFAWKASRAPGRLAVMLGSRGGTALYRANAMGYSAQAALNLRRARQTLSSANVVVTDRLHAAVFCGLLGIPVIAMDNSYGKISSIYNDYLCNVDNVNFASSAVEAVDYVNNYLS